jgi:hypothetical protein
MLFSLASRVCRNTLVVYHGGQNVLPNPLRVTIKTRNSFILQLTTDFEYFIRALKMRVMSVYKLFFVYIPNYHTITFSVLLSLSNFRNPKPGVTARI